MPLTREDESAIAYDMFIRFCISIETFHKVDTDRLLTLLRDAENEVNNEPYLNLFISQAIQFVVNSEGE